MEGVKVDIPLDLIDNIVAFNYLRNTPYTELQFSGEPTLHTDLAKIISRIKETGTLVSLSTNLTRLGDEIMTAFNMLDSITISFDSYCKEGYEISRPPHTWKEMVDNFEMFMNYISGDVFVNIQLLLTKWTEKWFDISKERLTGAIKRLDMPNVMLRYVDDCFGEQRTAARGQTPHTGKRTICLNPWLSVSIKADGTVVPCCFDFKKDIPLGSIYHESLGNIWHGAALAKLRSAHLSGSSQYLPEKCNRCYYRSPIKLVYSLLADLIKFKQTGALP